MKKNILVAGYYGYQNNGDDAILRVLLADLHRIDPNFSICVLSGDPEATRRVFSVESLANQDVAGIIAQARLSDALVIGGGGIFQDYWGAKIPTLLTWEQAGLPFYSSLPLLGRLLDKPVLIYGVGAGPLFSDDAKLLTRLSFDSANIATVRDKDSLELLRSVGISDRNINVTADPAFMLEPDIAHAREVLSNRGTDSGRPIVGVCVRNWDIGVDQSNWQAATATALDEFGDRTGCAFVFLPFQDLPASPLTKDSFSADAVIQQMKHRRDCHLLPFQEDPAVTAGILAACRLVVGMRYHSIVFAVSAGIPAVALAYDSKVSQLMDSLGLEEETLRLSGMTGAALFSCLVRVWENLPLFQEKLSGRVSDLKKSAGGNLKSLRKILAAAPARVSSGQAVDRFIKEFTLQKSLSSLEQTVRADELWAKVQKQEAASHVYVTQIQEKDHALQVLSDRIEDQSHKIETSNRELGREYQQIQTLNTQLNDIYRSRAWNLMLVLWNMRKRLIPNGSRLEGALRSIWRRLRDESFSRAGRASQPPPPFNDRYIIEDNSRVTLYADDPLLIPGYSPRKPLRNQLPDTLQVSLIATVKNEAGNVAKWIECIQKQTRPADEIIILDGGSTDRTDRLLEQWEQRNSLPVKLIRAPGTKIARGRNIAIREAHYPLIAITDFGCEPKPDWLEKLIQPFKIDPETCVSAGFYESVNRTGKVLSGNGVWPGLGNIDPQSFLPSSRSVAFRRQALDEVGGHPEWLTWTGDDTYLDLELKRLGGKWAFVPQAQVKWLAPEGLGAYLEKIYWWSRGDGESGVHARYYWRYLQQLSVWLVFSVLVVTGMIAVLVFRLAPILLWVILLCLAWLGVLGGISLKEKLPLHRTLQKGLGHVAQVLGFLKGARNSKEVDRTRKNDVVGVFFILSGVPLDDSGGGARGAQIAQELLRLGWGVVFLHKFERDETRNLQLHGLHPHLFQSSIEQFNLQEFKGKYPDLLKNKPVRVLVEFALPDYLSLSMQLLEEHSASVAYDLLDDWHSSLGGKWYSPDIEQQVILTSTHLVATLPKLAERLEKISARRPLLLPNAVNTRLFNLTVNYPRPVDLPGGRRILLYVGALWGDWFDWDLLGCLADSNPEAQVALIGDYRGQAHFIKTNVHFLGLKAQKELPNYLAHADAALLPWKVTSITRATSPLKVYEYLAMRLPVIAPSLEPLRGMPGVFLCDSREEFLKLAGSVTRSQLDEKELSEFIHLNTWSKRVEELLGYLDR